jgi:hypothetical protein
MLQLKSDESQLEDALTSFGGQWDWLVAPAPESQPPVQIQVSLIGRYRYTKLSRVLSSTVLWIVD